MRLSADGLEDIACTLFLFFGTSTLDGVIVITKVDWACHLCVKQAGILT